MPKILEGEIAMKKKKLLVIVLVIIVIVGSIFIALNQQAKKQTLNNENTLSNTESKLNATNETDKYGYKDLSELPKDYTIKQAIKDGCVVITNEKVFNKYRLDKFIENTEINAKDRKEDKIRIVQYTIEGDAIIKDLEYKIKDEKYKLGNEYVNKTTYILTTDNTRDKFAAEADRKITVNDDIPGDIYGILKVQREDMIAIVLELYALIDYIDSNVKIYEGIEVCEYRKSIEDSEVTIMEE